MSDRRVLRVLAVAIALSSALATAQNSPREALQREKPKRQKIVIIGASVSAGFEDPTSKREDGLSNRSYRMHLALKKAWPREVARIYNFSDIMMFMQSTKSGRRQIDAAKKREPDLVVAIDFPFWFGYGSVWGVKKDAVSKHRLKRQEQGLALLSELTGPMVVGDYPDMHGASTKMLPRSMIPDTATLAVLNEKLRAWAKKRENVYVFPLAKFVKEAVSKEQTMRYGDGEVVFPKNYLLQSDRLHATRMGMMVLTFRLSQALPKILAKGHVLVRHEVTFKQLVETAGIEDDLPEK